MEMYIIFVTRQGWNVILADYKDATDIQLLDIMMDSMKTGCSKGTQIMWKICSRVVENEKIIRKQQSLV